MLQTTPLAPTTDVGADAAADPAAAPRSRNLSLQAADGRRLAATWVEPVGAPRALAVLSSAAGVPRGYYRAFAHWMASRGYAVLSYDYRGIGESRQGPAARDPATMREWALQDMPAALAAAEARRQHQALPLLLVGHSFGGNCIGFAAGVERADALLMVASQHGEARLYPGPHRLVTGTFFRAWVPLVVALSGHLPGWALGGGAEALPGGVARDWADWGRTRGWAPAHAAMREHARHARVRAPVHLWNISDDLTFAPPRAVDALAAEFKHAATQRHELRPADVGRPRLGHFGPFRREPGPLLWQRLLAPLEAALPSLPR